MKKRNLALLGVGLASILAAGQTTQSIAQKSDHSNTSRELQANLPTKKKKTSVFNQIGGIPLETYYPNYGMSPKEYGERFGHGNPGGGKSNRLRYSHNAKLKRRIKNA